VPEIAGKYYFSPEAVRLNFIFERLRGMSGFGGKNFYTRVLAFKFPVSFSKPLLLLAS
jgi:hypothetical protein